MSDWFAVIRTRGAAWDESLPLRAQALWDPHADYMDRVEAAGSCGWQVRWKARATC